MEAVTILYPGIAMFALTFGVIAYLGASRYAAIHRKQVSIKYFRTYDEGEQPARLHLLSRHVQNHFEVPPLFYIGILFTFVSDSVTAAAVVFAWLYVSLRGVHSAIHLGSNDVSRRFFTFGFSPLALAGLWGSLAVSLVERALEQG